MERLRWLTLVSVVLSGLIFFLSKKEPTTVAFGPGLVVPKAWLKVKQSPITPQQYRRPADQTFLTYPEWFLVFSPEEQANYFRNHTSTTFPFMAHTAQIWESYNVVKAQIKDQFAYNGGYHFMIWVIGSSASVEYSIKAMYETLIGRITDTRNVETDEDRFNARYTKDYVDFIKVRPWYEFNFKSQFEALWRLPVFGNHQVRKWERRYLLTSELIVKYIYAKLIGFGTATVYETALPTTEVVIDKVPENLAFKILKTETDGILVSLPRYDQFAVAATTLAQSGIKFNEIAGNDSAILVTVIVARQANLELPDAQMIFTQPIASNPLKKRIAFVVPVAVLSQTLNTLKQTDVFVEHVFDF